MNRWLIGWLVSKIVKYLTNVNPCPMHLVGVRNRANAMLEFYKIEAYNLLFDFLIKYKLNIIDYQII